MQIHEAPNCATHCKICPGTSVPFWMSSNLERWPVLRPLLKGGAKSNVGIHLAALHGAPLLLVTRQADVQSRTPMDKGRRPSISTHLFSY